ncbi:hypothetical protein L6164_029755 [Bauhinia variegata]|uniref:Uncharacterized protein n=1 Tax=Bauhinia variegata TaxID=167791 RepID=A0ACB9LA41_BAUVA|nr:hypothetical protein L6164_029755 [Bauhinia variegata]
MAITEEENHVPNPNIGDAEEDDYEDVEDDEDEEDDLQDQRTPQSEESRLSQQRFKLENLFQRLSSERVPLRVHDVVIKGNTKTKDWVIEAEMEGIKSATTMQELLQAASVANAKLQGLEIFDSVNITLDSGPPELPGTANVIIEVSETERKLSGEFGVYTKPTGLHLEEVAGSQLLGIGLIWQMRDHGSRLIGDIMSIRDFRLSSPISSISPYLGSCQTMTSSWTVEGALKYKNGLGYGDIWNGSLAYGPNQTSEMSVGVFVPHFKGWLTPVVARVFMFSQDWQEFSSYKERLVGTSLGLFSTEHHDLAYTLGWRILTDPLQISSISIRRQLGHGLLSSLKYTFKLDMRNSPDRPTKGYAFLSSTQLAGLTPGDRSLRFLRQEFDFRFAIPFGFYHAALNFGISAGVIFPWGPGFLNKPSPLPDRFFLGGDFSPVCTLGGPTTLWGFRTRGLGPAEPRREIRGGDGDDNADPSRRDYIGGDLSVTAFGDLSFDLPIKWLRERGIHGHVFAGAGNIAKLTENEYRHFSHRKFLESFRTSMGCGIVIPTKLFRLEGNFYYILRRHENDRGKTGFRFSFSAPS